ncbi:hypothetical protein V8F33_014107 [Rhypophila sp. PSN 637]
MSSFAWACAPVALDNVTPGQIVDWNTYQISQNITIGVLRNPTEERCFLDFCHGLGWEGNPDLAGIGARSHDVAPADMVHNDQPQVFAAYLIQAIFTMGFLMTYLFRSLINLNLKRKGQPPLHSWKRLDECLAIFWISSFCFSLCILIASLSITYLSNNSQHAVYFSFFGSMFSVAVLGILWPWYQSRCTHPRLALTGFSLLFTLIAAISASYYNRDASWGTAFELSCFFRVCLGYFVQVRNDTSDLIGDKYAENEWGFGQILAVIAWIPTCVEFVKIWTWEYINTHIAPRIRSFLRLQPDSRSSGPSDNFEEVVRAALRDIELETTGGAAVTTPISPAMDIEAGTQSPVSIPQQPNGVSQQPSSNVPI